MVVYSSNTVRSVKNIDVCNSEVSNFQLRLKKYEINVKKKLYAWGLFRILKRHLVAVTYSKFSTELMVI
jgi:hypothetical protein